MPTKPGDKVQGPPGEPPRTVFEADDAGYCIEAQPIDDRHRLGQSSGERCSLYGTAKRPKEERR